MSRRRKPEEGRSASGRRAVGRRRGQEGTLRRKWLAVIGLAVGCGIVAALAAFLALGFWSSGPPGPPRAAILDQLSLTFPNPSFEEEATALLQQAGYEVDYFPGEEVTVDLYQDLARHDYEMLILRVHSGRLRGADGELTNDVVLFTGEPYSREIHVEERRANLLAKARYFRTDPPTYLFGIPVAFVETMMKGDFEGATVVLMGCDVLRAESMAEAFVRRGAAAVVGWDGKVSAAHTDAATEGVLRHLLVEGRTLPEAVAQTMTEVGPDPAYGSKLLLYPAEASASAVP